jgi:hypothetical protein
MKKSVPLPQESLGVYCAATDGMAHFPEQWEFDCFRAITPDDVGRYFLGAHSASVVLQIEADSTHLFGVKRMLLKPASQQSEVEPTTTPVTCTLYDLPCNKYFSVIWPNGKPYLLTKFTPHHSNYSQWIISMINMTDKHPFILLATESEMKQFQLKDVQAVEIEF